MPKKAKPPQGGKSNCYCQLEGRNCKDHIGGQSWCRTGKLGERVLLVDADP